MLALDDMQYSGGATNHARAIQEYQRTVLASSSNKKKFIKQNGRNYNTNKKITKQNGRVRFKSLSALFV